jgi:hypothetical protein
LGVTMGFLDFLCTTATPLTKYDDTSATFECDYDKNPTSLYQAMEDRAWVPTLEFFDTGKWNNAGLFSSAEDPLPAERQARTWVTRFEGDGKVRWSQLPLHGALIFGAPFKIVATVMTLYPQGVRCTDDQHMLPLHLAMKFGAEDNVVRLLIEHFPEALFTKDIRGRLPAQIDGPRKDRSKIMDEIITVTTKTLQKKHGHALQEEVADLRDDLVLQNKLNAELESQKKQLEVKSTRSQTEVVVLRNEIKDLQQQLKKSSKKFRAKPVVTESDNESDVSNKKTTRQQDISSKKTTRTRSFVFGKKKDTTRDSSGPEQDALVGRERPNSRGGSPETKSKTALEQALSNTKREETSFASDPEYDVPTDSKQVPSAETKKLPRRGFFKGFGAKE